jgi:hypothetical protein
MATTSADRSIKVINKQGIGASEVALCSGRTKKPWCYLLVDDELMMMIIIMIMMRVLVAASCLNS